MSYAFRPTVADVRALRPFKATDEALESYIDLAETASYNFLTSSAIPSETARRQLWALMAAHLATVMREPEAQSSHIGQIAVTWAQATSREGLEESKPGKEFLARWRRYNRGWVLR